MATLVASEEARPHELAQTLSTVARQLDAEPDEEQTLAGIVAAAIDTVPGAAYGGLTQVEDGGRITARAPSDELVRLCDEKENALQEGPCLDALWQQQTVIIHDMASETRWPNFAAYAASRGAGSMIAFRLYVGHDDLGSLNLYGSQGVRFDAETQLIGELFASHAAIALSGAREYRQMSEALATRDMIGQAKGILMARENTTAQHAFTLLVHASQHANLKLHAVAQWLIDDHHHPGNATRPTTE